MLFRFLPLVAVCLTLNLGALPNTPTRCETIQQALAELQTAELLPVDRIVGAASLTPPCDYDRVTNPTGGCISCEGTLTCTAAYDPFTGLLIYCECI
jgi:hypothetical protein